MSDPGPDQQRWLRVKQLVADAVTRTPAERGRFLADACSGDEMMQREVEALLAAHDDAGDFFERSRVPSAMRAAAASLMIGVELAPGHRLSHYELLEAIGAGGMGVVYKARDTRLHRTVAIKFLTPHVATHGQARERFHREARAVAALNHPHICTLYDIGEAPGSDPSSSEPIRFLVMELVDGPTLADRIAQGPIPVDEALPIARQIAEALEAAHEQGIIHRDLKPANVKLRSDGTVKVLDFGLAKPRTFGADTVGDDGPLNSPTITSPAMTAIGVILGTAAYMSPEQAKGRAADKRSDVWAFGCILYEMFTGKRTFAGDDVADTMASVLRDEPDWNALPHNVPAAIRVIVRRCLEKDPRRRIADFSTIRFVVDEPAISTAVGGARAEPAAAPSMLWRRAVPIVATTIVASIATGVAVWTLRSGPSTSPAVTRFPLAIEDERAFASNGLRLVAISHDGSRIAYAALSPGDQATVSTQRLYVRSMSEDVARPVASQERGVIGAPVFSPDGHSIAFYVGPPGNVLGQEKGMLNRVGADGAGLVTLAEVELPLGMSWSGDSILLGQPSKGIVRVLASSGQAEQMVATKDGETAQGPQLLPGGQAVLFTLASGRLSSPGLTDEAWDKADIVVQSLQSGVRKTLIHGGSDARYVPTGHLIYAVAGTLRAVGFDTDRLELTGKPVPVLEGIGRSRLGPRNRTGAAHFSVSDIGSLVYLPGPVSPSSTRRNLAFFDRRTGVIEPLKLPAAMYESLRVSQDGRQIAVGINDGRQADVWLYDLSGSTAIRQLTSGGKNRFPVWSPDGQYVAFQSDREGDLAVFRQRVDGTATAARLTTPNRSSSHTPNSWSPRNDALLFDVETGSKFALWMLTLHDGSVAPIGDAQTGSIPSAAVISPDGRWVAYQSGELPVPRIFVQALTTAGARLPIANGRYPGWSRDGKQLFYHSASQLFAVTLSMNPSFSVGNPSRAMTPLLETAMRLETGTEAAATARRNYDLSADGNRILGMVDETPVSTAAARRIEVVLNWFEELKLKVPTR
jgi:serine/threonine protein kinase